MSRASFSAAGAVAAAVFVASTSSASVSLPVRLTEPLSSFSIFLLPLLLLFPSLLLLFPSLLLLSLLLLILLLLSLPSFFLLLDSFFPASGFSSLLCLFSFS